MVVFSVRNLNNGNSHRISNIPYEDAEKLFFDATERGMAACVFIFDDGIHDHPLAGIYLLQNKKHADFERTHC